MTSLSETILEAYQIRKTRAQKTEFIQFLQSRMPELEVEAGGFGKNRNLVLGDIANAKVILTAHYDTCARLPFPNFITPTNFPVYLLYNLLICIPFLLVMALSFALLQWLTHSSLLSLLGAYLLFLGAMVLVLMGGKPNPHTANDNTSGVITLCELIEALPAEVKAQTAFVFFDNEENGLLGSAYFRKRHKRDSLEEKLVVNFDCVSDGDHLLFVLNKPARKRYAQALETAFSSTPEKTCHFTSSTKAFYPSDQANFPVSIAVAAMNRNKLVGLYMNRIHTEKDTIFDRENISLLCTGTQALLFGLLAKQGITTTDRNPSPPKC